MCSNLGFTQEKFKNLESILPKFNICNISQAVINKDRSTVEIE